MQSSMSNRRKETQLFSTQNLVKMALCIAFCCVSAFISFPLPLTPGLVTALTIALTVTALVLPPQLAFLTVAAYVLLGAIGLPIYPGGIGGLGRLFGPTGGFYIGWPFVCFIESLCKGQQVSFRRYALVAVCRRDVLERGDLAHQALVCLLAHAAGEKDRNVGFLERAHGERPCHLEHAGDALRVVLVHLAPEGLLPVGHSGEGLLPVCFIEVHKTWFLSATGV